MEGGGGGAEEQCASLHKHYQHMAREYKKLERRLVECQKKQLEVCEIVCGGTPGKLPAGTSSYILVALLVALLEQSGQSLRPPEVAHLLWEG